MERTLAQMVERIVKRFTPEKVILFGSHAAGRAGLDSDVDLLVVMTPNRSIAAQEWSVTRIELRRETIHILPEHLCRTEWPC